MRRQLYLRMVNTAYEEYVREMREALMELVRVLGSKTSEEAMRQAAEEYKRRTDAARRRYDEAVNALWREYGEPGSTPLVTLG